MNQAKLLKLLSGLGLVLMFSVACGAPVASPPVSPASPTPADEVYAPVDPAELAFTVKGLNIRSVVGQPQATSGVVQELLCEGKTVELASTTLEGGFLETKQYGKIKIDLSSSLSSSGVSVWLTPQQKDAMVKAFKSPAAPTSIACTGVPFGYWMSIGDAKYTVAFSDSQGQPLALAELQGTVHWDQTSCIVDGAESFLRLQVQPDGWLNITRREIIQGRLALTDERGNQYLITQFSPSLTGVMTRQSPGQAIPGGTQIAAPARTPTLAQTPTARPAATSAPTITPTRSPTQNLYASPTLVMPAEGNYASIGPFGDGIRGFQLTFQVVGLEIRTMKMVIQTESAKCEINLIYSIPIQRVNSRDSSYLTSFSISEQGTSITGQIYPTVMVPYDASRYYPLRRAGTADGEYSVQTCPGAPQWTPQQGSWIAMLVTATAVPTAGAALPNATQPLVSTPTASAAPSATQIPTPGINCDNPLARFTVPGMNAVIRGTQSFTGTANTPDFAFYKVQYMPDASWGTDKWGELYKNANRVQDGKLFEWQTQTVAPGGYWLRLLVTAADGNYGQPCLLHVTITR